MYPRTRLCPLLDALVRPRPTVPTDEIRDDLDARVAEVEREGWLCEVEGLQISLAGAKNKPAQIVAVPAEPLDTERPLLGPLPSLGAQIGKLVVQQSPTSPKQVEVRVVDGRLRVAFLGNVIAAHPVVAPGETSIIGAHYDGPRLAPRRAVRPKTKAKIAFCALGPTADAFIKAAVAAGTTSLGGDLEDLAAGTGVPAVTEPGSCDSERCAAWPPSC